MKIVEPSAHIEELPKNVYQRIDKAASVCYQRPAKPTIKEAKKFCQKMIDSKHGMALEFATLHLFIPWTYAHRFDECKYLSVNTSVYGSVVTGSIRAFREASGAGAGMVREWLQKEYPLFFNGGFSISPVFKIRFAQPNEIPWRHEHVAVRVVCSRAISHQLVRHRPCAILQESQRYCRYDGERFDGEVTFIRPIWTEGEIIFRGVFLEDCAEAESRYFDRLKCCGLTPQESRGILSNDAKTELLIYANLLEWQHILDTETMRCSPHADPEMRRIMLPLREEFKARWPEHF